MRDHNGNFKETAPEVTSQLVARALGMVYLLEETLLRGRKKREEGLLPPRIQIS